LAALPTPCTITVNTVQGEYQLPFQAGSTLREILIASGFALRSACGGNATCGQCQVRVAESSSIPFTANERLRLSAAQLSDGLRLACQFIPGSDLHVSVVQPNAQMTWRLMRGDEYSRISSHPSNHKSAVIYGVAIDLGTTNIRLTLWNLIRNERIAGLTGLNPQSSYGADVLTRLMEASSSKEIADEIGSLVVRALTDAFKYFAAQYSIELCDIGKVLVVGNTAMLSLLGGRNYAQLLQPNNWTQRIDCQPLETDYLRIAWGIGKNAAIDFIPPLGGFVGSDVLAGLIAIRLMKQPAGSALIDFGTNSEMALWDGHTIHVTSTAGGPAFEGCGISCGMQGEPGAIYRVEQRDEHGFDIRVLDDIEPKGLCGSGLVDAVAWLRRNGRLDKVGRFLKHESTGFVLHEGSPRIDLKRCDIDVFQRAKAAIGGGLKWLCQQAGLSVGELNQVYACGAFGRLLNMSNAQQVGLLPPIPPAAIKLDGNIAIAGCEVLLLLSEWEPALDAVLAVSKVYNMAEDVGFETLFIENLYLQPMQE